MFHPCIWLYNIHIRVHYTITYILVYTRYTPRMQLERNGRKSLPTVWTLSMNNITTISVNNRFQGGRILIFPRKYLNIMKYEVIFTLHMNKSVSSRNFKVAWYDFCDDGLHYSRYPRYREAEVCLIISRYSQLWWGEE